MKSPSGFPPLEVAPLMAELVAWLNAPTEIHPVLVSGIAQFQLVHIHPFVDGNGRTSRLLSTLCLYRAGTTSNGYFRSANITIATGRRFTQRSRACAITGWT